MPEPMKPAEARRPRLPSDRPNFKRPAGARPIGTWQRFCGFCGLTSQVVTDGRMLLCSTCGH